MKKTKKTGRPQGSATQTKNINCRCSPETRRQIDVLCKKWGENLSRAISRLIAQEYIKNEKGNDAEKES